MHATRPHDASHQPWTGRRVMRGVRSPESDAMKTQMSHGVAQGRSNNCMHATARHEVSHDSRAGRRVIPALGALAPIAPTILMNVSKLLVITSGRKENHK